MRECSPGLTPRGRDPYAREDGPAWRRRYRCGMSAWAGARRGSERATSMPASRLRALIPRSPVGPAQRTACSRPCRGWNGPRSPELPTTMCSVSVRLVIASEPERRGIRRCQTHADIPRQAAPFHAFSGASVRPQGADASSKFPLVPPWVILLDPFSETWPSGRRRSPAKGVGGKPSRGFESLRLCHSRSRSERPLDVGRSPESSCWRRRGHPRVLQRSCRHWRWSRPSGGNG